MPRPFFGVRQHVAALESGDSSPHSKRAHCRAPLQKTRVLKTERGNHRRHREGAENTEGHWVGARQCLARFFGVRQHVACPECIEGPLWSAATRRRTPKRPFDALRTGNMLPHSKKTGEALPRPYPMAFCVFCAFSVSSVVSPFCFQNARFL